MTEEEFSRLKAEGMEGLGRCPYCRKPGWIAGDPDWCPHVAGYWDWFHGSEPSSPLADGPEFDAAREALRAVASLSNRRQKAILNKMPKPAAELLQRILDEPIELFWKALVRGRRLTVDIDEFMFSTTYETVFVTDRELARATLHRRLKPLLRALSRASIESMRPGEG